MPSQVCCNCCCKALMLALLRPAASAGRVANARQLGHWCVVLSDSVAWLGARLLAPVLAVVPALLQVAAALASLLLMP
jgi:hypothetical protein